MTAPNARRPSQKFSRPLAEFVNRTLDPLVAKQGFGESSLLLQWETIIGARIAGLCQPIRLRWPPRAKSRAPDKPDEPATLVLRVRTGLWPRHPAYERRDHQSRECAFGLALHRQDRSCAGAPALQPAKARARRAARPSCARSCRASDARSGRRGAARGFGEARRARIDAHVRPQRAQL